MAGSTSTAPQALRRRLVLVWPALLPALALVGAHRPGWAKPASPASVLDLVRLRQLDLTPAWYTSANWGNRSYDPWTDYISGELSEADFSRACARTSDYCLRDIWNMRKPVPDAVDWEKTPPNWNGVHALALRFFRTGKVVYLNKWMAVVSDYAAWTERQTEAGRLATAKQMPAPLLDAAFTWGGIFNACVIAAKGLTHPETGGEAKRSPYAPAPGELTGEQAARLPEEFIARVGTAFARGPAPDLAKAYVQARYIPNQRVFGLEAIALASTIQPRLDEIRKLRPALDAGVADAAERYRQLDGGQLEQSFNYARDVVDGLTRLQALPLDPAPAWRAAAAQTVTGWKRFSQAIALPGGGLLPQLGNAAAGRVETGTDLRFAATSMAFPYSGVYCQRSSWSAEAGYLFFFARRAARGHSMAGSNSLQVHAYGRPLLVAGGSSDYRPVTDGNRRSAAYLNEESSWKTSTVLVDGLSQKAGSVEGLPKDDKGNPETTRAPTMPIQARWLSSDTLDYLEGRHTTGYQRTLAGTPGSSVDDVSHWRQVIFVRPLMLWLVVDVLQSRASHRYTQIWKFAPPGGAAKAAGFQQDEVAASANDGTIRTQKPGGDHVNLSLHQFNPTGMTYRKHFASDGFGYYSRGPMSEAEPGVDVHAEWEGQGPQVCVTAMAPHRGGEATLTTVTNRSNPGLAGCDLITRSGAKVSVMAAATPRSLSLGGFQVANADLLLHVQIPGRDLLQLVISAEDSAVTEGKAKTAILVPGSFRWETGTGGLSPVYRT